MNQKIKLCIILTIIFLILFAWIMPTWVSAFSAGQVMGDAEGFIDNGKKQNKIDVNKIGEILKPVAGVLLGIGTVVLVAVGTIMGIKYMTSPPDAQGKLKTQFVGLIVATIVLYGAYGIWVIIYKFMEGITG